MDIEKASSGSDHASKAADDLPARVNENADTAAIDESDRRLRELGYRPEFRVGLLVRGRNEVEGRHL